MGESVKKKMGRPRVFTPEMDKQLHALLRMRPTLEDTAAFFQCGTTTVEEHIRREYDLTFRELRDQCFVHTRYDLVRRAINKAQNGDNQMHIICLKNLCGWREKVDHSGDVSNQQIIQIKIDKDDAGL
jgi:hypothetical protein